MQSLICIHCGNRFDAHVADESALDRFSEASGWTRVPTVALRIVSAHGSIGRNVAALANGVAAHPGQSVVASSDGTTCWVLGSSPSAIASFTAAARAAGWHVTQLPPPSAGERACSISCVAAAVRRETDDHGQHWWNASADPRRYDSRKHIPPAVAPAREIEQRCAAGCSAALKHGADDSEAQKAARRTAHGWRGDYCSVPCSRRSVAVDARQVDVIHEPLWPPAPAATPAAPPPPSPQPAPQRTRATRATR